MGILEIAKADPITFTGSSGSLSASVTFDISSTNLLVTLVNTSTGDPSAPGDILTGVIFLIPGNTSLNRSAGSAKLSSGSTVIHGPVPAGGVVGGEWAYTNDLTGTPFVGQQSIYSSGYFDGNAKFPGNNLQGPKSVGGVQYGITTLFDLPENDNGGIKNEGLIQNSVDFVLPGLPSGFKLSDISNVSFQYGTSLGEPNLTGFGETKVIDVQVPEPGILILLGIAMSAIGAASRFVRKL